MRGWVRDGDWESGGGVRAEGRSHEMGQSQDPGSRGLSRWRAQAGTWRRLSPRPRPPLTRLCGGPAGHEEDVQGVRQVP